MWNHVESLFPARRKIARGYDGLERLIDVRAETGAPAVVATYD